MKYDNILTTAQWLNGRGIGARYDGTYNKGGQGSSYIGSCDGKYTGSVKGLSDADRSNIKRYIEAQFVAFEKADGWIFWTWKTESAPGTLPPLTLFLPIEYAY
jgi:glucan 1,3-beta-glucosidase